MKNLESTLSKNDLSLRRETNSLLTGSYRPEYDLTLVCDVSNTRLYTSLFEILWWLAELGTVHITCEVSIMSSYVAMSRDGHLNPILYIFSDLKQHHVSVANAF